MSNQNADLIAYNGKIATQNEQRSMVEAVAVLDGKFLAIGTDREVMAYRGEQTQLINLNKRTAHKNQGDHCQLSQRASRRSARSMASGHMSNLVRHHAGQFRFIFRQQYRA